MTTLPKHEAAILLDAFEKRARGLGLLLTTLTPALTFSLVRDMPYRRASDRLPPTSIAEWRGTCSGKHYLLAELLRAQGLDARVCIAEHVFLPETAPWLPRELLDALPPGGCPDVHTYLEALRDGAWTPVDATWPAPAGALGFAVNEWDAPPTIAAVALRVYRPDGDPQAFKEQIIERWVDAHMPLRERIIAWISDTLGALEAARASR